MRECEFKLISQRGVMCVYSCVSVYFSYFLLLFLLVVVALQELLLLRLREFCFTTNTILRAIFSYDLLQIPDDRRG